MLLKNLDEFDRISKVGDWCFVSTDETYIAIRLGEDFMTGVCILPIVKIGSSKENFLAAWDWNGDKEKPTLTPSILHWGNGRKNPSTWHGYMTDGILKEC